VAVRIVHCADVHLETAFTEARGGRARRAALADAFGRVVDLALERRADALTIGGDLFELERAGPQTARFLASELARFGGAVYIAPGNHDPYVAGGIYARGDLPANVRVFSESGWLAFSIADDVTLYGFAHTPAEPGPPFADARFERPGTRIALVHGSDAARCPPGKRLTAPFYAKDVVASGASLLLTGHYHGGYIERAADGRPIFAYPGSLEPIRFTEQGAHGALVVTVEGGRVDVEPVEMARTRLLDITCDLNGTQSEHDALARIAQSLESLGTCDYVRLRLRGQPQLGTRIDCALIAERFESGLGTLDIADDTLTYDYESVAREPTVRGHVARDLLDLAGSSETRESEEALLALRFALAAFSGEDIAP